MESSQDPCQPVCLPELPLFTMATDNKANWEQSATTVAVQQGLSKSVASVALVRSGSQYDPAAELHLKLVTAVLKLEFIEMSKLIPDMWHEDGHASPDGGEAQRCPPHCPPLTDIMTWLQCYASLAAVLSTRYPDKAPELWAYQSLIIRAARNYERQAWVAYDHQYRREALAKGDLNWSTLDSRLYNEAFMGRARAIAHCQHCLSEALGSVNCPSNPNPSSYQPLVEVGNAPGTLLGAGSRQEICKCFNKGRCRFLHSKYLHICKECFHPHLWITCRNNSQAIQRKRRRLCSPR